MSKSKSQRRREAIQKKRKERYYGIVKLPAGTKFAWLAKQDKNGWALGLGLNNRTVWLRGLRLRSRKEVERCLERTKLVFVQLKNNPEE